MLYPSNKQIIKDKAEMWVDITYKYGRYKATIQLSKKIE